MTLSERMKCILSERNLKQVEFAKALGISANYVNQLINGKKQTISDTLAKLIEETYGYSATWLTTGVGESRTASMLSPLKMELLKKVQKMSEEEISALLAFARYLEEIKESHLSEGDL